MREWLKRYWLHVLGGLGLVLIGVAIGSAANWAWGFEPQLGTVGQRVDLVVQ